MKWYPAHGQDLATARTKVESEFTIQVNATIDNNSGRTPGQGNEEKLRMVLWLGEQGLICNVDYEVRSDPRSNNYSYWFKDANKAMLFKLAWA